MLLKMLMYLIFVSCLCCGSSGVSSITDLEDGLINQLINLSYEQCVAECNNSLKCASVKYFRRYTHCKLFGIEVQLTQGGTHGSDEFVVYTKHADVRKEHLSKHKQCGVEDSDATWSCQPQSCPEQMIAGATMFGNALAIGSVVKYQCIDTTDFETSTCQPDGRWSPVRLACNCKKSGPFEFEVSTYNTTHITASRICPNGTRLVQTVSPSCDLGSGTWIDTDLACCESTDSEWVKVFRFSKGYNLPIMVTWRGPTGFIDGDEYMRSPLLDDWDTLNITSVKVEVNTDGVTVAFMVFNAWNSNTESWFALERLVNSSWDSLRVNSSVENFNIQGNIIGSRFVVSSSGTGDVCTASRGWFAVSKLFTQCPATGLIEILYASPTDGPMLFKDMIRADEFVVWLKHN